MVRVFAPDIVIDNKVIVELKAVKAIIAEHEAQVLNDLKASDHEVALLVNFGVPRVEYKRYYRGKAVTS